MKTPDWRWLVVLVTMLFVTFVLVAVNFLPWFASMLGVFSGLMVYHFFFVSQVKKEADHQLDRANKRSVNLAS